MKVHAARKHRVISYLHYVMFTMNHVIFFAIVPHILETHNVLLDFRTSETTSIHLVKRKKKDIENKILYLQGVDKSRLHDECFKK